MPLPKYVQEAFDNKGLFAKESPPQVMAPQVMAPQVGTPQVGTPETTLETPKTDVPLVKGTGLPDYVTKEIEKRKQPEEEEWDPEWMGRSPILAGLYGAGKGLLEQAVVPTIETIGMIGGSVGSPIVGTALGYGIARQLSDFLVDSYKRLGGEEVKSQTIKEEILQSAADVGTVLVMGAAMETGVKIAPYVEDYLFKKLPQRLYASAIKTPMSKKWIQTLPNEIVSKQTAAVEEGLRSRIPPSKYGLSKIKGLEKEVSGYIDDITKILSKDPSKFIDRETVLKDGLAKAYDKASNSSDPIGAKAIVDAIAERFRAHPSSLTPAKANQIKRQLYKEVKFGSAEPSAIKAQLDLVGKKGVAREIMLNLEQTYPALAELNATDAARISLTEAIEKAYAREAQKNMIPLGAKILMRPKTWPLSLWEATMGHPQVKARLAFALHKSNPVKYPPKPVSYTPPITPTPKVITPPITPTLTPKVITPPESFVGLRGLPKGDYTSSQLDKMLKSKDVVTVDIAIESIMDKRMKEHLTRREHVTVVNKMLKNLKNESGSVPFGTGKKKLTELVTKPVQSIIENPKDTLTSLIKETTTPYQKNKLKAIQKFVHPEGIEKTISAAIKDPEGKIYTGITHQGAFSKMPEKFRQYPQPNPELIIEGYMTDKGNFMTNKEAKILFGRDESAFLRLKGSLSKSEFIKEFGKQFPNKMEALADKLKTFKPVTKPVTKPITKPVTKPKKLYFGTNQNIKTSADLSEGHRGYFAVESKDVASKFGKVYEVSIDKTNLFDARNNKQFDSFIEEYKRRFPKSNKILVESMAKSGNYAFYENPKVKFLLEDLGYKGNWQKEEGINVFRVLNKKDFKVKPVTKPVKETAYHGTDIDALEGILEKGVHKGSAIDFTKDHSWSSEYPIQIELERAKKGTYIEHNKYYKLANDVKPSKIIIDLDQYTEAGAEDVLKKLDKFRKKYPKVNMIIKGTKPGKDALTKTNITEHYQKEYDLSIKDAKEAAKTDLEDINFGRIKSMFGYKKPIRNMEEYKKYLKWLEDGKF